MRTRENLTMSPYPTALQKYKIKSMFKHDLTVLTASSDKKLNLNYFWVMLPTEIFEDIQKDKKVYGAVSKWFCGSIRARDPSSGCIVCGRQNKEKLGIEFSLNFEDSIYTLYFLCDNPECSKNSESVLLKFAETLEQQNRA